jgi:hypothetical protein
MPVALDLVALLKELRIIAEKIMLMFVPSTIFVSLLE